MIVKKKSLPLSAFFTEKESKEKFRVKIEYVSGPMRGMVITSVSNKSFKINKLVKNKKDGNYRVLSVENL
jgi:hypothetical protein